MKFQSSVLLGGSIFPMEITVNEDDITFKQTALLTPTVSTVKKRNISSVSICNEIIGASITVTCRGGEKYVGEGFSYSDCQKIKELI